MTHARAMTKGSALKLQVGAALAAVTVVSFAILQVSSAAFSDQTSPAEGTWSSAEVSIDHNDWGGVAFTADDMVPTDTDQACIDVTYDGTVAADVKLYGTVDGGLGEYLDLKIEEVDLGDGDCANPDVVDDIYADTLAEFTYTEWATGLDSNFTPQGEGETQTYRFTVTLQNDNDAQGKDAGATFTWEAQNS